MAQQQCATGHPTLVHTMQQSVAPVRADCYSSYPVSYPAQQVAWPQYVDYHATPPPPINLYGAPKPSIPDFVVDSERDFANLKLALDNL